MAQTYSQSLTGIDANARYGVPKTIRVGDADIAGNPVGVSAPAQGETMRIGTQILCKNPDGSQSWYTIDAERSVPGVSLVMVKV